MASVAQKTSELKKSPPSKLIGSASQTNGAVTAKAASNAALTKSPKAKATAAPPPKSPSSPRTPSSPKMSNAETTVPKVTRSPSAKTISTTPKAKPIERKNSDIAGAKNGLNVAEKAEIVAPTMPIVDVKNDGSSDGGKVNDIPLTETGSGEIGNLGNDVVANTDQKQTEHSASTVTSAEITKNDDYASGDKKHDTKEDVVEPPKPVSYSEVGTPFSIPTQAPNTEPPLPLTIGEIEAAKSAKNDAAKAEEQTESAGPVIVETTVTEVVDNAPSTPAVVKEENADSAPPVTTVSEAEFDENAKITTEKSSTPIESPDASANHSGETAVVTDEEQPSPKESKHTIRTRIWQHLEKNDLVLFPRPCKNRIPNFVGANKAADKLSQLDAFRNAKVIEVNPDKAQESVRFHILEFGKRLIVPATRLSNGLFNAIIPPMESSKFMLKQCSQRFGMKKFSKPIGLNDEMNVDLVVLGSVAVDKKGHRIGKGKGYADLEFALALKMNAVNENTLIVTTVHDDQVFDELPEHLFQKHDVPVDMIVTPTQVIQVTERLPRPAGIYWDLLSNRRVKEMPILQQLKETDTKEGVDCTLKATDTEDEESPQPTTQEDVFKKSFGRRRRFNYRSTGDPIRDSRMSQTPDEYYEPRRQYGPPPQRYQRSEYDRRRSRYEEGPRRFEEGPRRYEEGPRRYYATQPMQTSYAGHPRMRNGYREEAYEYGPPRRNNRSRSRNMSQRLYDERNSGRGPRTNRRVTDRSSSGGRGDVKSVEVQTTRAKTASNGRSYSRRKRAPIEFSLRVKNMANEVRVRDLKNALTERGVKPRDITWKGYQGSAFLHFVKTISKEDNKQLTVEDAMRMLDGLTLPSKNKKTLVIEPAKPKNPPVTPAVPPVPVEPSAQPIVEPAPLPIEATA